MIHCLPKTQFHILLSSALCELFVSFESIIFFAFKQDFNLMQWLCMENFYWAISWFHVSTSSVTVGKIPFGSIPLTKTFQGLQAYFWTQASDRCLESSLENNHFCCRKGTPCCPHMTTLRIDQLGEHVHIRPELNLVWNRTRNRNSFHNLYRGFKDKIGSNTSINHKSWSTKTTVTEISSTFWLSPIVIGPAISKPGLIPLHS